MYANIDDDEAGIGISDVGGDEGAEALLACGIPELQTECFSVNLHGLGHEVDSDSGLNGLATTLEVNSKESWMNLDMIDVLPTFWSPTSTTLNLLNLGIYI